MLNCYYKMFYSEGLLSFRCNEFLEQIKKNLLKYEYNLTRLNIKNIALSLYGTQPTSQSFCNNSSLRWIEQMLSENVD